MGYKLGFIGCGNMGGALLQAALGVVTPADIAVSEKNEQLLSDICDKYGCSSEDSVTIAEECEYIFLDLCCRSFGFCLVHYEIRYLKNMF